MKQLFLFVLLFLPGIFYAQDKVTISGYITDSYSGERLIGATIYHDGRSAGTVTNNYGFFSLTGETGNNWLTTRFVGYEPGNLNIITSKDTLITIELKRGVAIEEIEVHGRAFQESNPEISSLSHPRVTIEMVESTPVILGEKDILKTLQYLPGIKQSAENTAGINVRGGSNDQNLILLDGIPVYNVNHLLGFFSVFNPDAIKNVSLFKGGIPARYGGRLSSVMDISMKEGNLKNSRTTFSISPVAGRITHEAPIKQDTAAYIISLRRTFFDLPLMAFQKLSGTNGTFAYHFYDLNAKANWIVDTKNRLYLSVYAGKDVQHVDTPENPESNKTKYRYRWGNVASSLRWNKAFSSSVFANTSFYYSRFTHNELGKSGTGDDEVTFQNTTTLADACLKSDFDFYVADNYILRWGGSFSYLSFSPYIIQERSSQRDTTLNKQNKTNAGQTDFYIENALKSGRFSLNFGLRLSGYFTAHKNYINLQPRVALNYSFLNNLNISGSYIHMVQNTHLLTNSSLGMPTELWVASTDRIGPERSRQFSLGFSKHLLHGVSLGAEAYYKWLNDVVRFEEGASFINPQELDWEDNVVVGNGRAYGLELEAKKEEGQFTGIMSYTLSWSERKFNELNNGNWFPFKYDRRHDFSILAGYKLKESYKTTKSISLGFTFQSGNNLSLPDMEYEGMPTPGTEFDTDGHVYPWLQTKQTYENPNNFKMPPFHHLDIGYNIVKQKTDSKRVTWSFSVYNVYNRMNPWYYYKDGENVKQVSLFPIVPSVGFKYEF